MIQMIDVIQQFDGCAFKILAKSDTGKESGNICGILIPRVLRNIFPILAVPRIAGQIVSKEIRVKLLVPQEANVVNTTYRAQTRTGKRNPETRITGNLKALRDLATVDDILIIRSVYNSSTDYELQILPKGMVEYEAVKAIIGMRRWGIIGHQGGFYGGGDAGKPPVPVYRRANLPSQRTLIARIERIEAIVGSASISLEFDGINAGLSIDDVSRALVDPQITEPFALVRIVSTLGKLKQVFGDRLAEGAWAELVLEPPTKAFGPLAFLAQLGDTGYTTRLNGKLGSGRILLGPDEEPRDFPEAGASVPAATATARKIAQKCHLPGPRLNGAAISSLLSPVLAQPASLQVRDVGQASFVTILADDGSELAHFDAGWPISYNDRTAPAALPLVAPVPVILSHWDWDHLHGFHTIKNIASSVWIVPDQIVGPGAMKVANILHAVSRLKIWTGGTPVSIGTSTLYACIGGPNLNNSGIAMTIKLGSGKLALLVGDACYRNIGMPPHRTFDLLVATHHGAAFDGDAPSPSAKKGSCVVSVGRHNVYRHPCATALAKHKDKHWTITRTSGEGREKRGDRVLG